MMNSLDRCFTVCVVGGVFLTLSSSIGCRKPNPDVQSVMADIATVSRRIQFPKIPYADTLDFGEGLVKRISELKDAKARRTCLDEFEGRIYATPVDSPEFNVRRFQVKAFLEMSGMLSLGALLIDGREEDYWERRLRQVGWLQSKIAETESLMKRMPAIPGKRAHYFREHYLDLLRQDYALLVREMEETYDEKTVKLVSSKRAAAIKGRIEHAIGRRVRTLEEIAKDRWGRDSRSAVQKHRQEYCGDIEVDANP